MKSLMLLWQVVAKELATRCDTSTTGDINTVARRSEHEGFLPFMAITLPTFGKAFESWLDQGKVDLTLTPKFRSEGLRPQFLKGFVDLVFDRTTGLLLDSPSVEAIFAVRQLTLMFAKILEPCSDERVRDAMLGYVECENEVRSTSERLAGTPDLEAFASTFQVLFRNVLTDLDNDIRDGKLVPKHGPGATADRLRGNAKYDQTEWTQRLEQIFPFGDNALPSWRSYYLLDHVDFVEPGAERPVRVIAVPKTQKTPRIIAIEPTCMQYMQQAILERLVELLEAENFAASKMIGFTDQVPNQHLARMSSLEGNLATLDLSEASDRVSWLLVREAFAKYPHLLEAIDATRSRTADVLGHGVIPISKFASMGSALTFPVEAMVFFTCAFMGIRDTLSPELSVREVLYLMDGKVRIYGDDIIVPVDSVSSVVAYLNLYGFKVNAGKSFWTGSFRESCGKEFFAGEDVSITRVRRELPVRRTDVLEIISTVSLRNQLYKAGLWVSARFLDDLLEEVLPHYPTVHETSPVLGRHTFLDYQVDRMHADLHAPLVKGFAVSSTPPHSEVSGEGALLKWFLKRGDQPFEDENHLERQGRPTSVYIKKKWLQPF